MYDPPFTLVSPTSPRGCSHEEIKEIFQKYGKLYGDGLRFSIAKKDDRLYIDYTNVGSAMKAFKALNGQLCSDFGPTFRFTLQYSRETKLKLVAMGLLDETVARIAMPKRMPAGPVKKAEVATTLVGSGIDLNPPSSRPLHVRRSFASSTSIIKNLNTQKPTISSLRAEATPTRRFAKDVAITMAERAQKQLELLQKKKQIETVTPSLRTSALFTATVESQSDTPVPSEYPPTLLDNINPSSSFTSTTESHSVKNLASSFPLLPTASASQLQTSSYASQSTCSPPDMTESRHRTMQVQPAVSRDAKLSRDEEIIFDDSSAPEMSSLELENKIANNGSIVERITNNPSSNVDELSSQSESQGSSELKNTFLQLLAGFSNAPSVVRPASTFTSLTELLNTVDGPNNEVGNPLFGQEQKAATQKSTITDMSFKSKISKGKIAGAKRISERRIRKNSDVIDVTTKSNAVLIGSSVPSEEQHPSISTGDLLPIAASMTPSVIIETTVVEDSLVGAPPVKIQASGLIAAVKGTLSERKREQEALETAEKEASINKVNGMTRVPLSQTVDNCDSSTQVEDEAGAGLNSGKVVREGSTIGNQNCARKRLNLTRKVNEDLGEPKVKRRLLRPAERKTDVSSLVSGSYLQSNTEKSYSKAAIPESALDSSSDSTNLFQPSLNGYPLTSLDIHTWLMKAQEAMAVHSGLFFLESNPPLIQFNYSDMSDWIVQSINSRVGAQQRPLYSQPVVLIPSLPLLTDLKPSNLIVPIEM